MADVDLRPMTLGEVLDRTFNVYKKHFWLFVGIMSMPLLLLLAFQIVAVALGIGAAATAVKTGPPSPAAVGGIVGEIFGGVIIFLIAFVIAYGAAEAATVFAVSDLYLGRSVTIRGSFARVRGKVLRAIGVIILTGLIVGAGFIALIVPGLILLARTGLSVPVAMLEDETPASAISRSMELTKGFGWSMFVIFVLYWVLSILATMVFQYPLMFLTLATASNHGATSILLLVLQDVASFVSSAVVGPISTIAFCLMYYNLRVRKEAFDLQHLMASLGSGSAPALETPPAPTAV